MDLWFEGLRLNTHCLVNVTGKGLAQRRPRRAHLALVAAEHFQNGRPDAPNVNMI
jgi:hypothetical protein